MKSIEQDLSIIIVSWNAKDYLEKCLKSILKTVGSLDAEVIVVDNASTDGSCELVSQDFPSVRLFRNSANLGFAGGNNIGIRQASGKYCVLVNSDVVVFENCLQGMMEYMDLHSDIGILGPRITGTDGKVQRSCMGFPTLWNSLCRALTLDTLFPRIRIFGGFMMNFWGHDSIRDVDIINGCFWFVRQEALDGVGLLDDDFFMYAEDMDWCKRFHEHDWKVTYYPVAEVLHYGGASSSQAPIKFYLEMQKANIKYWGKHHGYSSQMLYRGILLVHHLLRMLGQFVFCVVGYKDRKACMFKAERSLASLRVVLNL